MVVLYVGKGYHHRTPPGNINEIIAGLQPHYCDNGVLQVEARPLSAWLEYQTLHVYMRTPGTTNWHLHSMVGEKKNPLSVKPTDGGSFHLNWVFFGGVRGFSLPGWVFSTTSWGGGFFPFG